jgi:hypothetical protein
MGLATKLVQEMLWWAEGLLENTKKWLDLVQYHLDGDLPVLLHSGRHDSHRSRYAVF